MSGSQNLIKFGRTTYHSQSSASIFIKKPILRKHFIASLQIISKNAKVITQKGDSNHRIS
jgi:hypothetical protein